MTNEKANSFKFSTFIHLALGLILPLWPITLPLFFYFAYKSYKRGDEEGASMSDLKSAKDLLDTGVISQDEFDAIKIRQQVSSALTSC